MNTPEIDYKTRRELRKKLGSRVGRRAGTKSGDRNRGARNRRKAGVATKQLKPRIRLNEAIRAELAKREADAVIAEAA
jgi:hypothetical protein